MSSAPTIAIHQNPDAGSYTQRWQVYLSKLGIPFRIVDCFSNDIIAALSDCDALLWHWRRGEHTDSKYAPLILDAAEQAGKVVFPNRHTRMHYDNKIGQKYSLESIGAPLAPTYIFFCLEDATTWIREATFPKVFKLSRGAGSENVKLVCDRRAAQALARRAFGPGFPPVSSYLDDFNFKIRRIANGRALLEKLQRMPALVKQRRRLRSENVREKGYIYFQDFIPGNHSDMRVTVIGDRAFIFRRKVRPNDFRASGSGSISHYEPGCGDVEALKLSFELATKLFSQSIAFDYIVDQDNGRLLLLEVSFAYSAAVIRDCKGYFDRGINWHDGAFWPQDLIIDDLLGTIQRQKARDRAPGSRGEAVTVAISAGSSVRQVED